MEIPAHGPLPSVLLSLIQPFPSPLSTPSLPCPFTHHQLSEADIKLLWVRDRTGELHVLQRVVIAEVDLRELVAPKAAQEAQAMAAPLAGGHGHCRPGGRSTGRGALGPHRDLGGHTESTERSSAWQQGKWGRWSLSHHNFFSQLPEALNPIGKLLSFSHSFSLFSLAPSSSRQLAPPHHTLSVFPATHTFRFPLCAPKEEERAVVTECDFGMSELALFLSLCHCQMGILFPIIWQTHFQEGSRTHFIHSGVWCTSHGEGRLEVF